MTEALMELYRGAVFEVDGDGHRVRILLDEVNPALDSLLTRHHATGGWAFITAYDPGEERPSAEENQRAQRRLEDHVRRAGLRMWAGDGASPDRKHVEPSTLIVGVDLVSARALGRAFRQRAIVVGAIGEPARLVDLAVALNESRGLPVPHHSGQTLFVEELHVTRLFAGWLEGGPDGERVRQDVFDAAAAVGGLPVHVRMPAVLSRSANRKFVVENAPRALCTARVHSSPPGDGTPPVSWSVAWPSLTVGDAALEELLHAGLFDAPLLPRGTDVLDDESQLPAQDPLPSSRRGAFHDLVLRSQDGWMPEIDSLHFGLASGVIEGAAAGDVSAAEIGRRHRGWENAPVVYVASTTGIASAAPDKLELPDGAAAMRISLVADPVHHSREDPEAYWRSRVMLLAVVEPGTQPLRRTIESVVGLLPWKDWATDADETP